MIRDVVGGGAASTTCKLINAAAKTHLHTHEYNAFTTASKGSRIRSSNYNKELGHLVHKTQSKARPMLLNAAQKGSRRGKKKAEKIGMRQKD